MDSNTYAFTDTPAETVDVLGEQAALDAAEEGGEYNLADHVEMSELAPERTSGAELERMLQAAIVARAAWTAVYADGQFSHWEALDGRVCFCPVRKANGAKLLRNMSVWDDTTGSVVTHVTLNAQQNSAYLMKQLAARRVNVD